ncbi:MAG: hypothetical protein LBT49_05410 [Prevotellaceae bacterium]|jgi:uncharacterized protein (TIGR02145 family)|nr:hypothetical protein [Prevotellaceae bacterium]
MKKLFLLMLLCPVMLPAQITISEFSVKPGSPATVTFNMQWTPPTDKNKVWSDTVWVFVDYNDKGEMKRLPLSGATLTNSSWAAASVTMIDGNPNGAWVIGNARLPRGEGSFSATVRLLTASTATTNFPGACVYTINYPPMGNIGGNKITFTGTPPFHLRLDDESSFTVSSTYILPVGSTLTSFTDASGAPGRIIISCTPPGFTTDFTVFEPCSDAATGATWTLTDTRDGKSYKVRKMPDGRYWMVQALRFGDCTDNSWMVDESIAATTATPTVAPGYVGHCRTTTLSGAGYKYNWPAAMNNSLAYHGSSSNIGCSGTCTGKTGSCPAVCQGICPDGWHIPTGNADGEIATLLRALESFTGCKSCTCYGVDSWWERVNSGLCWGGQMQYVNQCDDTWTSTYSSSTQARNEQACNDGCYPTGNDNNEKRDGTDVRCVMNY